MLIFLMWRNGRGIDPREVETRLQRLFAPLFETPPASRILENDAAALVSLEIPIKGWIPPSFEREGAAWALGIEYPVTARAVLQRRGVHVPEGRTLLTLAEGLQKNPEPLLRDLAPMFSLAWSPRKDEAYLQNDGLGLAQLFEYDDGRAWAVSNKLHAFRALGLGLDPVPEEWAVRMTVDWFPLLLTGYRHIRFMAPGTRLRLSAAGVERQTYDVLGHWLRRDPALSPQDCLELSYAGFQAHIRAVAPQWAEANCGLTGGRDSRAVVSGLLREGVENVSFSVRGWQQSPDVKVALKLARQAGLKLKIRNRALQPPDSPEELRRCLDLALLWQAGYTDIRQHAAFLNGSPGLDGGEVNIMGQHGEIGRAYFAERINALKRPAGQFEEALLRFAVFENTPGQFIIRRDRLEFIRETVRAAFRQAGRYGLEGLDRLDFFYLYERTRRWASAGNHVQQGIIITPFLNPEYIHAVYNYPAAGRAEEPFHREILRRNRPNWAGVIHAKELQVKLDKKDNRRLRRQSRTGYYLMRAGQAIDTIKRRYWPELLRPKADHYWVHRGRPVVDGVMAERDFWTEVFDPDKVRKVWFLAPEQVVVTGRVGHACREWP